MAKDGLGLTGDFGALADGDERLRRHLVKKRDGKVSLNFASGEALHALAAAQLLVDFKLNGWSLPAIDRHLVPTVPSRLAYLVFIHQTLLGSKADQNHTLALDIGTGGSCIYPLLGASRFGFRYVATDIDQSAIMVAKANLQAVGYASDTVDIKLTSAEDPIFPDYTFFEYSLCNPPFHSDIRESRVHPKRARTGSSGQYATSGGEKNFVLRVMEESSRDETRRRIRWFTALVGRKVDLAPLTRAARAKGALVKTHQILLGHTARWVIAWSYFPQGRWTEENHAVRILEKLPFRFTISLDLASWGGELMTDQDILETLHAAALDLNPNRVDLHRGPDALELTWDQEPRLAAKATFVPGASHTGESFKVACKLEGCEGVSGVSEMAEQFISALSRLISPDL